MAATNGSAMRVAKAVTAEPVVTNRSVISAPSNQR
jgi:hypothetical protein